MHTGGDIIYTHTTSYAVEICDNKSSMRNLMNKYRSAVEYLIPVVDSLWNNIAAISGILYKQKFVEEKIHSTRNHTAVYDFDTVFHKFPSYLRRSAIREAVGIVSSYKTQLEQWIESGCCGTEPKLVYKHFACPALYKGDMFKWNDDGTASIKVFRNNDWQWVRAKLKRTDLKYLEKRKRVNTSCEVFSPVLEKRPKGKWFLRFTLKEKVTFEDKPVEERRVCAVDLGVNTDATCSVIDVHGTVLSRKFINRGREKDSVDNALRRVSAFQREHGSHDSGRLWNLAKRRNLNLAHQIAHDIVEHAREQGCDVIVFEYLDMKGRKHGRKQKLAMWKHQDIQSTAESLAHKYGMRISRVSAKNTSKYAYDGSGTIKRGKQVSKDTPYDVCRFTTGKMYNCDLSASYNIGARYFIRELYKEKADAMAEVPGIGSGTRRVMADLWLINATLGL